jgi:hypothetical protein
MQVAETLVYGRTRCLVDAQGGLDGAAHAGYSDLIPEDTVDIQATDDLLHLLVRSGRSNLLNRSTEVRADKLLDKSWMSALAAELGVPVPEVLTIEPTTYPVVVKSVVGAGGDLVRVVHSPEALAGAKAELAGLSDQSQLVQEHLGYGQVTVGAVAQRGKLLVAAAYVAHPASYDPLGPPAEVEAIQRPDLIDFTQRLASAVGASGFLCLDYVLDEQGTAHFIDFNPRAFGSWPALQSLGVDFIGAYMHLMGLGSAPEGGDVKYGSRQTLLRFPSGARNARELGLWVAGSTHVISSRAQMLGWRWAVLSSAKVAAGAAVTAVGLLNGRIVRRRWRQAGP